MKLSFSNSTEVSFISSIYTENTGGNIMIDFITLTDGKLLAISLEGIGLYENMESFDNGDNPIQFIER